MAYSVSPKLGGGGLPRWRNWYTRMLEVHVPQGLEVRVLSWAQSIIFMENPLKNKDPKQELWDRTQQEVESIGDRLGMGIEENIKETVIALKVCGFGTTGSCEGHIDWGFPYPWIDVESLQAETNSIIGGRYDTLRNKFKDIEDVNNQNPSEKEEFEELQILQRKEVEDNEVVCQRLNQLLQEFYEQFPNNTVSKLVINKGPWNQSRLQPEGGQLRGLKAKKQYDEYLSTLSNEEKEKKLIEYREEMKKFTDFIKFKFFNE